MNYDDTRFGNMFSRYGGWKRIVASPDFIAALLVGLAGGVAIGVKGIGPSFIGVAIIPFLTISAAMIATSLAGLSIISSISDPKYVRFTKATPVDGSSVYENVVFVFWFTSVVSIASLFIDLAGGLSSSLVSSVALANFFAGLMLFFLLYAVLAVAMLLGSVTRWGLYRGLFVEAGSPELPPPPTQ